EMDFARGSAIFKGDVLAHHVAIIAQAVPEVIPDRGIFITNDADARDPRRLGAGRERPRHRRAAEQRDELAAPHHSITSSAATCNVSGTFRPSAFAVFRLMTSSNLVGCRTGNSAGFSPLRIPPA